MDGTLARSADNSLDRRRDGLARKTVPIGSFILTKQVIYCLDQEIEIGWVPLDLQSRTKFQIAGGRLGERRRRHVGDDFRKTVQLLYGEFRISVNRQFTNHEAFLSFSTIRS